MEMKGLKGIITGGTLLVQLFCAFWILGRGFMALILITLDWQATPNAATEFLRFCYEMIWVGLLPILLFEPLRRFLYRLVDHQLFTEESYKISRNLFILTACWPIFSILWDIFIDQKSIHHWLDLIENIVLPHVDDLALVFILGVLHLVIKNGKMIQEDVDGFV